MTDNAPKPSKPLPEKKYCLRSESNGDDIVLFFDSVEGLPDGCIEKEGTETEDLLLVIEGMEAPKNCPALREGAVYTICRVIGDIEVDVAGIHCKQLLHRAGARHHWLISVGWARMPLALILDAWLGGVPVGWRALNPLYRPSWIEACMKLAASRNWRQVLVTERVVLSVTGLQAIEDFYCHLGEALFGDWGYAGNSNLDAFEEVLRANQPERILFCIPDEAGFDAFLARTTGRPDYATVFKQIVIEAGARLSTAC
ncbi:hypothetical protein SAMN05518854_12329 [Variovorax sp. YR266]|uniref:hypothetical protein n=1 Tax=Variovorax sp. YR266 TaxID=1884386 RepID=UPI0008971926|nr:hypothetical protein [Variovorax sp. YR266]SDZ72150.1 hypothetical protein SAMN05518854_12329 [Variovorax sp. YR266]